MIIYLKNSLFWDRLSLYVGFKVYFFLYNDEKSEW